MGEVAPGERYWGRPNPKQAEFFESTARFTAYGGARGGGKSWAVRKKAALLCINYANIRVLLLRRSYGELRENHILPLQQDLAGIARYNETQKTFSFSNGARLRFGYCNSEGDLMRYQGQEYDVVFIDEATQFSERQFRMLAASVRGANALPKRVYLTCNPGGVGHDWVKRLFISRDYKKGERAADYAFIPAKVSDNPKIAESGDYMAMLCALPEQLRRAWLDGDWDILAGRYFPEFSRETHVVAPFALPGSWARYFAMDYGLDMLAGYWIALAPNGEAYVYREIYESALIVSVAAKKIREMSTEFVDEFIAPPDLWNRRQDTGKSAAEIFSDCGVALARANNSRVQGWYELKEWLLPRRCEDGAPRPRLRIFDTCENLIRSLLALQHDERDPNDAAKTPHELTHAPDALRYFAAARPRPAGFEARAAMTPQEQSLLEYGR